MSFNETAAISVFVLATLTGWVQSGPPAPTSVEGSPDDLVIRVSSPGGDQLSVIRAGDDRLTPLQNEVTVTADEQGRTILIRGGCVRGAWYVMTMGDHIAFLPDVPEDCSEPFLLESFPLAKFVATGTFEGDVPDWVDAEIYPCPGAKENTRLLGRVRAPLDEDLRFVIPVAVGCNRLRLTADGHAPRQVAAFELAPREVRTHPTMHFHEGGSLAARVFSPAGEPVAGALVAVSEAPTEATRSVVPQLPAPMATTNDEGWVFFEGLGAGRIHIHVTPPDGLEQASEEYLIEASRELVVDPLQLVSPARLTVVLDVPEELREDGLHLVGVTIRPVDVVSHATKPVRQGVGPDGVAHFELVPGKWEVIAAGRLSHSTTMTIGKTEVEVLPAEDRLLTISVQDALFTGRLMAAQEPVSHPNAQLALTPEDPSSNARVTVQVDEDGRFRTLLSEPGRFSGSLQLGHEHSITIPVILFEDPEDEVVIELPTGTIAGTVVGEDGAGVGGAMVEATVRSINEEEVLLERSASRTAPDGTFEFPYARDGTWTMAATHGDLRSQSQTLDLSQGTSVAEVELKLAGSLHVVVRVVDAGNRPVPNAIVTVRPVPRTLAETPASQFGRTDALGKTEIELAESSLADVIVEAAGIVGGVRQQMGDGPVVVRLPLTTGQVRLRRPMSDPWVPTATRFQRIISSEGTQIPPRSITPVRSPTTDLVLPALPPGHWLYAEAVTWEEAFALANGQVQPFVRASFTVQAGHETVVLIDQEDH